MLIFVFEATRLDVKVFLPTEPLNDYRRDRDDQGWPRMLIKVTLGPGYGD
jgi:hypothetical protein